MIETKDVNRSLIIPKWRSIRSPSLEAFEFYCKSKASVQIQTTTDLNAEYLNFQSEPDLTKAAELLHAAILLNKAKIAEEAGEYIVSKGTASKALNRFAKKVIAKDEAVPLVEHTLNEQISQIKIMLRQYPRDPLLWAEVARLYTTKGQLLKAKKAIMTSFTMAPDNRYIARSTSRYFLHINEPDIATQLLRKAYYINPDPMILATLINCSLVAEKPFKEYRVPPKSLSLAELYQNSELIATIGILEMKEGSDRKAKKLFKTGWLAPTENVIANADWVKRNKYPDMNLGEKIDYKRSAEASTWREFYAHNISEAIEMSIKWGREEPYSTHPFACGSSIAILAGEHLTAIKLIKDGLKANPSDIVLLNNLVYALLKENRTSDAEKYMAKIPNIVDDKLTPVIDATRGYSFFKQGKIDAGRDAYLCAIEIIKKRNNDFFLAHAMLYHAIAEKEAHTDLAANYIEKALNVSDRHKEDPGIKLLRDEILRVLS